VRDHDDVINAGGGKYASCSAGVLTPVAVVYVVCWRGVGWGGGEVT